MTARQCGQEIHKSRVGYDVVKMLSYFRVLLLGQKKRLFWTYVREEEGPDVCMWECCLGDLHCSNLDL